MKKIFATLLCTIAISTAASARGTSRWYYQCIGTVDWPTCVDVVVKDPQSDLPTTVRNCGPKTFTNEEELKAATRLNYAYAFTYVGKSPIFGGRTAQISGICEGWSNRSNYCSYAKDTSGNDLVCDRSTLGKYIVTP